MFRWIPVAALMIAGVSAGTAQAGTRTELAFLDNIAQHGFERVADLYPDIVYLHTSGNGCHSYQPTSYQDIIPSDPAEQTRIGLCTLSQMFREAQISLDSVEEARITVRQESLVEVVRQVVESDARYSELNWEVRVNSQLSINNEDALLSIDVVAISPGSEALLLALPAIGTTPFLSN